MRTLPSPRSVTKQSYFGYVLIFIVFILFFISLPGTAENRDEVMFSEYVLDMNISSKKLNQHDLPVQSEKSSSTGENLATVYFCTIGTTPQFQIYDGEKHIGAIYANHTIKYKVAAGNQIFSAGFLAGNTVPYVTSISLNIEEGGVYYLVCIDKKRQFKLKDVSHDKDLVTIIDRKISKNKVLVKSEKEIQKFKKQFGAEIIAAKSNRDLPVSNRREDIFRLIQEKGMLAEKNVTSIPRIAQEDANIKISKSKGPNSSTLKYRRSSLYTLSIHDDTREYNDIIRDAFGNFELSVKFNDHNLGPYLIPGSGGENNQANMISRYLEKNQVAKGLVAKWFNRDAEGGFNMEMVAERGAYDASAIDIKIAKQSQRGNALLADAGEELIKNTFVIVNDFRYTSYSETGSLGIRLSLKGYIIKTTSYLYRLEWNDDIANIFYNNLWIDKGQKDPERKKAFENSDLFKLKYIGSQTAWAEVTRSTLSNKSQEELIAIATARAADKAYSKLQRVYEEFRTKSPLLNVEPITAKIGLKEGIEKGDEFEVLEQIIDNLGRTSYKRIGIIKVDEGKIWDNTGYGEENSQDLEFTYFQGSSRGLFPGLLIRQIN